MAVCLLKVVVAPVDTGLETFTRDACSRAYLTEQQLRSIALATWRARALTPARLDLTGHAPPSSFLSFLPSHCGVLACTSN